MRHIWSSILFGVSGIFLSAFPALAQQRGDWGYGPYGPGQMWWMMGTGMGFLMIVFWLVVIVGAVALIRWVFISGRNGQAGGSPAAETAADILKKRYARGEINKEEFEEKMRDIQR
ncbi:MAG: SHOCT domain-containing protein [bacterium]|nr:SHOCT domain-containing protein [bacterium]